MNTTASEDVLILAIESSCDETAASVVKNGRTVLSNMMNTDQRLMGSISNGLGLCHAY